MTLEEKISYLRKKEGLSQEEFAEKLSVSRQSVYKWETGESIPSVDKLKNIVEIFNVSFDFLMDDSLGKESFNGQADGMESTKRRNKPRTVYYTKFRLCSGQADLDNGYTDKSKTKRSSENYLRDNIEKAKKAFEKLNITEYIQVESNSATFFFYDKNNYVCGFFYAGMFQFICPVENLLGFTYNGGGQVITNSKATVGFGGGNVSTFTNTCAEAILLYKDGDAVEEFHLNFSVNYWSQFYELKPKVEEQNFLWAANMEDLKRNLSRIQVRISSLIQIGQDIKYEKIEVEQYDLEAIKEANVGLKSEYDKYLEDVEEGVKNDNFQSAILKACLWLVGTVLAIIAITSIIKG